MARNRPGCDPEVKIEGILASGKADVIKVKDNGSRPAGIIFTGGGAFVGNRRIYSFIDCADADARMWGWDPNPAPGDDIGKALFKEELTLCEWLGRWANGQLIQPVLIQEAGGQWRGATEEEKAAWMTES